jgi:hypothetical protein
MSAVSVSQMVRALSNERTGMASWEREAVHVAHTQSCHGLKPYHLTQRQCELILTIFNRIYKC